jgi:hypothetical protein
VEKLEFYGAWARCGVEEPMYRGKWSGRRPDRVAVFSIWQHEIKRKGPGEYEAEWFGNEGAPLSAQRAASADKFLALAAENIGKPCRMFMVVGDKTKSGQIAYCLPCDDKAIIPLEVDAATLTFRARYVEHAWE